MSVLKDCPGWDFWLDYTLMFLACALASVAFDGFTSLGTIAARAFLWSILWLGPHLSIYFYGPGSRERTALGTGSIKASKNPR